MHAIKKFLKCFFVLLGFESSKYVITSTIFMKLRQTGFQIWLARGPPHLGI